MEETTIRPLRFPSGELSLEAVLHLPASTPSPGVVVCHPHPKYGGDMDNNVVMAACEALMRSGFAALRFNFRGAGDSDGAFDQGDGEREDVRAALRHIASLSEIETKRIGLAGYSFGAMMAAEVASAGLRGLVLISPPVAVGDMRVEWGCPALVVGVEQDQLAPAERLRVLAESSSVELRLFPGADHSWWGQEDDMSAALTEFFKQQFQ